MQARLAVNLIRKEVLQDLQDVEDENQTKHAEKDASVQRGKIPAVKKYVIDETVDPLSKERIWRFTQIEVAPVCKHG